MSEKTDINEIENNSPTEKPDEVAKGKKKSRKKKDRPVGRKIIKKIVRVVKETETVKPEEPLEDKASLTNEAGEEKAGERDLKRIKCHFVALSRAKGLICIALPKKLVDESRINQLTKAGWTICKI